MDIICMYTHMKIHPRISMYMHIEIYLHIYTNASMYKCIKYINVMFEYIRVHILGSRAWCANSAHPKYLAATKNENTVKIQAKDIPSPIEF